MICKRGKRDSEEIVANLAPDHFHGTAWRRPLRADNHLHLRLQLLGPEIRLKVKSRLERGVEVIGEGVEGKAGKKKSLLRFVWIKLVGSVYDKRLSLRGC